MTAAKKLRERKKKLLGRRVRFRPNTKRGRKLIEDGFSGGWIVNAYKESKGNGSPDQSFKKAKFLFNVLIGEVGNRQFTLVHQDDVIISRSKNREEQWLKNFFF